MPFCQRKPVEGDFAALSMTGSNTSLNRLRTPDEPPSEP